MTEKGGGRNRGHDKEKTKRSFKTEEGFWGGEKNHERFFLAFLAAACHSFACRFSPPVLLHSSFSVLSTSIPDHGDRVARQGRAITVTIAYRLNAFGFLASDALRSQTPDGSVGNYGLQDQRAGMQWVQENIAAFGGNPSKVMLYGESAGGASVSLHMLMSKSAGLFSSATIESGAYAFWTSNKLDGAAAETYNKVVKGLGCTGTDEEIVACLKVRCLGRDGLCLAVQWVDCEQEQITERNVV